MRALIAAVLAVFLFCLAADGAAAQDEGSKHMGESPYPSAVFGGGCFWCVESEFAGLPGVVSTAVGYSGGTLENPTYEQVSTAKTGHAEVVLVAYDPQETDYRALVEFFLTRAHDPTEIDRQGVDVGPQYRSVIFYYDESQKKTAEKEIARLTGEKRFAKPIATQIVPFEKFWRAEEYHQKYYDKYEAKTGRPHIRALKHRK